MMCNEADLHRVVHRNNVSLYFRVEIHLRIIYATVRTCCANEIHLRITCATSAQHCILNEILAQHIFKAVCLTSEVDNLVPTTIYAIVATIGASIVMWLDLWDTLYSQVCWVIIRIVNFCAKKTRPKGPDPALPSSLRPYIFYFIGVT